MVNLKVHIIYDFHKGPWGGANQFLKALKNELVKRNLYETNPEKANCILFNSHHMLEDIIKLKKKKQTIIIFHRIDGPVFLIRKKDLEIDKKIFKINHLIAEGTIFQSNWSREKNYQLGLKNNRFETVIVNAPDPDIFYPKKDRRVKDWSNEKCKLISASWSPSFSKGFALYRFLDNHLDFKKFSMQFIGNSPIKFRNIEYLKPLHPEELAEMFRESDIYIIGSQNDPCSNSLIEALSCGLPAIVYNDGGHPEILKKGGETFYNFEECLIKIEKVRDNYSIYKGQINIHGIDEIASKYINFMKKSYLSCIFNKKKLKKINLIQYYKILLELNLLPISNIKNIANNLFFIISKIKSIRLKIFKLKEV